MPPLVKIRSERDQMSAIERRIADFLLDNAHLLRDYSSQQLADALKISQSSVVKFSQKLGFKGYPDLKFSIGEAVARTNGAGPERAGRSSRTTPDTLAEDLWHDKSRAQEETRAINPSDRIEAAVRALDAAGKVFVLGLAHDNVAAQAFAARLASLGIVALPHIDPTLLVSCLPMARAGDVLLAVSEHGKTAELAQLCRQFRERRCKVISITRHSTNAVRPHADIALLVSAHDNRPHVEPLLFQAAMQHLFDVLFVQLCAEDDSRVKRLSESSERSRRLFDA
jgi:DNA-binding MurR/RpiR family transcriptional regulator